MRKYYTDSIATNSQLTVYCKIPGTGTTICSRWFHTCQLKDHVRLYSDVSYLHSSTIRLHKNHVICKESRIVNKRTTTMQTPNLLVLLTDTFTELLQNLGCGGVDIGVFRG